MPCTEASSYLCSPGPEYRAAPSYSCEFTGKSFRQFTKSGQLEFRISTFTVSDECGEQRRILLRNRAARQLS
jgi:hypothetical protein